MGRSVGRCLNESQLLEIVAGGVSEECHRETTRHLDTCSNCQKRLDRAAGATLIQEQLKSLSNANQELNSTPALQQAMRSLVSNRSKDCQREPESPLEFDVLTLLESRPTSSTEDPGLGWFGCYKVLSVAGRGGMGVVLKAFDPTLERFVALKIISLQPTSHLRERFLLEARSAAALVHENVVTIFAADELNGIPYIAMQFVDGHSLRDLIDRNGSLPADQVIEIAQQIAAGLAAAHRRGLVHRDIKPANLLIDSQTGRALLSDFGLVKQSMGVASDVEDLRSQEGVILGTPLFMSPEQAVGRPVDARSDLFSLGSVLYASCTGKAPFNGVSPVEVLHEVCHASPEPIETINPDVPHPLIEIVNRLLRKQPDDRFQSAEQLLAALDSIRGESATTNYLKTNDVSMSPAMRLVIICMMVGLAVWMAIWTLNSTSTDQPSDNIAKSVFRLSSNGKSFLTLAEAIANIGNSGEIEIVGTGPYSVQPVSIGNKHVLLRSTQGAVLTASHSGPMLSIEGTCVLKGLTLIHNIAGNISAPVCRQQFNQWQSNAVVMVKPGGSLVMKHCDINSAGQRIGVSHAGESVSIENCAIHAPKGIGVAWQGSDLATLHVEGSRVGSQIGFYLESLDVGAKLYVRRCNWSCELDRNRDWQSQFIRLGRDVSPKQPATIQLESNFIVGDSLIHLGDQKLRDLISGEIEIEESGNVYCVPAFLYNRNHSDSELASFRTRFGIEDDSSVSVQVTRSPSVPLNQAAIDWQGSEPRTEFGAPNDVGPK